MGSGQQPPPLTVWVTERVTLGLALPVEYTDAGIVAPPVEELTPVLEAEAELDGVDPAGAQNGPMLNVARCVPSMDASGDADAMDGDPEGDGRPVATCASGGEGGGG